MALSYKRIFHASTPIEAKAAKQTTAGDRRDGHVYVYTDEIELAVNVALATSRPLLIRGPSGSGKSSLAKNVALKLGRRYYEHVLSSVTEARDLLWRFDSVRQLSDATTRTETTTEYPPNRYLEPGVLWWAFHRQSAELRGLTAAHPDVPPATDPAEGDKSGERAVVLLDEIDKADPDVPNNLLVPLGSLQFSITWPERTIKADDDKAPFVIITTNEERELPAAFLRRCVVVALPAPPREKLLRIAAEHFKDENPDLFARVADFMEDIARVKRQRGEPVPSTAEYLDAITACRALEVAVDKDDAAWTQVARAILEKPQAWSEPSA